MRTLILLLLAGCVGQTPPLEYSQRAFPECSEHQVESHWLAGESQTEISMVCDDERRSITIKCVHGFNIISPTVCHENN